MSPLKPKKLHGSQFLWGAHHPHCERHRHHLIWIKGHPFCLGCLSLFTGMVIGTFVVYSTLPIELSLPTWVITHLLLLVPTAIQPYFQFRVFKIFSRSLLGVCIASYFITGFYVRSPIDLWPFLLAQTALFTIVYFLLSRWRLRKIDNPCSKCPQGRYPVCEWNLPRLLVDPEQKEIFRVLSIKEEV